MKRLHWDIALRQATDSGQGLSAFLSRLSVLGMIIAVSVLLAALSVMNGFEREMRVRILSLVPHVTIRGYADEIEWGQIQSDLVELSSVLRTVRFTDLDAMLTADGQAQVIRLAIADSQVLPVYESYLAPPISSLRANEVILGSALASSLGVRVGDRVSALYSVGAVGNRLVPGGLSVVSILDSETEIDQIFALAGPNSGKLNQLELGSGLSLTLSDPLVAARLSSQLKVALTPNFWVTDWTSSQGNLYQAIELSRRIVILMLASLNVVTSLVLVVSDRRASSSMLRAMGLTGADIALIFIIQGGIIGAGGAGLGALFGFILASLTPYLVFALEAYTGSPLLDTAVYPLAYVPVDIRIYDFIAVPVAALLLSVASCALPAMTAARLSVTEGLRESR
jgi:lipoprotein-releasing system permease protein